MSISIHAPREGGDYNKAKIVKLFLISIHAPREGGDGQDHHREKRRRQFQSTPPARGATERPSGALLG